jgi:hypothetical protein
MDIFIYILLSTQLLTLVLKLWNNGLGYLNRHATTLNIANIKANKKRTTSCVQIFFTQLLKKFSAVITLEDSLSYLHESDTESSSEPV